MMYKSAKQGVANILYATGFACDGIDEVGAYAGNFGHAAMLQLGCVTGVSTGVVDERTVFAICCITEIETPLIVSRVMPFCF